ncbi:hypothetical protein [Anaeromyxobacter paludicola]|uniref:Uncharacterized protein n=1 Tax=Anaeromyxobacter paludicola TaxID=2918171 RepID=A0ABN6N7V2_9BACT|nr:hypothetical protein [Anaeromyxobacter paludicola]BDG09234.1 hypothetical protein AMPC_23470 [Anaeromyxobacter paludicola]
MRPLALAAVLLMAAPALATEAVAVSVEGLARASDAVVRGRVTRLGATLSPDRRRVYTIVDLAVTARWRGKPAGSLQVIVPGGTVGDLTQRVDGAPELAKGEDVVLFLDRAEAGAYRVNGLAQGKFAVKGQTASPDLSHTNFITQRIAAGERRAEAMSTAELERRVRSVP